MKKDMKSQKGFTLVEIICAIALLGIIAVPTYNVFVGAAVSQNKSKVQQSANNTAQSVMEEILASDTVTATAYPKDNFLVDVSFDAISSSLNDNLNSGGKYTINYSDQTIEETEGGSKEDIIPNKPKKYGLRVEVFDYADKDIYMLTRTGAYLLFGNFNKIDAYFADPSSYSESSFFSSYSSFKIFEKYDEDKIKSVLGISKWDYDRMYSCYAGLPREEVVKFMKTLISRHNEMIANVKWRIPTGYDGSNWNETQNYVNYILKSENMYETIRELYLALQETPVTHPFFDGLTGSYATNIKTNVVNLYNQMNDTVFNEGTKTGPLLRSKVFWYDESLALIPPNDTEYAVFTTGTTGQGSNHCDLYFQFYQRLLMFGDWGFSIPLDNESAANRFNITLEDVQTNYWTVQKNIFKDITYYVTGALDYRTITFGIEAQPNILTQKYDKTTGEYSTYYANVNFFQTLFHGGTMMEIEKYGNHDNLTWNQNVDDNIDETHGSTTSTTTTTKSVDVSKLDSLALKTITVKLYNRDDNLKKSPLVVLTSYKNTGTGKFVTSSSTKTETTVSTPTPDANKEDIVSISDLPAYTEANVKVTFSSANKKNTTAIYNNANSVVETLDKHPSVGTMSFSGKSFSFDYGKQFTTENVKNKFPFTTHINSSDIDKIVWVFEGTSNASSPKFTINVTGNEVEQSKKTIFVIYNYSDIDISVTGTPKNLLKYGGVVVVDKNNNIKIIK